MFTPTVNYLGPAHPQPETEFYVLPRTRAGENPLWVSELLRSLRSRELPAASAPGATDSSPRDWSWN